MRTAIFGGSFNPIHLGHLVMADEILGSGLCEKVLFVPAFMPPHKSIADPGADFRYSMIQESIEGLDGLGVDECEIQRRGISYTIDTIRRLVEEKTITPKPLLLIGDDLAEGFWKWREPEALLEACEIVVFHRKYRERWPAAFPHTYVDNPILPISSTMVRERIAQGKPWRFLVPDGARKIIETNRLYLDKNA